MMSIEALRKHFGLSQPQLANLLEVSTSSIKLAETGNRNISPAVLPIFLNLVRVAEAGPAPAAQAPTAVQNKEQIAAGAELNKYIKNTMVTLRQQETELEKMKIRHQQALNRQPILQTEKNIRASIGTSEPWLEVLINKTDEQLEKNGPKARAVLQLKIDINAYGLQKALQLEAEFKAQ